MSKVSVMLWNIYNIDYLAGYVLPPGGSFGDLMWNYNNNTSPSSYHTYDQGDSATFVATPQPGWGIRALEVRKADFYYALTPPYIVVSSVDLSGVTPGDSVPYTFVNLQPTGNVAYSLWGLDATYARVYTITATSGANGSVSPSGVKKIFSGDSQAYTITPSAGYQVSDVLVDGRSIGAVTSYTFSGVTENHTIHVTFVLTPPVTHTITSSAGANGSISPLGATVVTHGDSQTFAITPDTGYKISDVLVDGSSVGALSAFTFSNVTQDHTIAASFDAVSAKYTVTVTIVGNGEVNYDLNLVYGDLYASGTIEVDAGDTLYLRGYPLEDNIFIGFWLDPETVNESWYLDPPYDNQLIISDIHENHVVHVVFEGIKHTITSSAGPGGSISPDGATEVNHDGNQEYVITPDTDYAVQSLIVDGVVVTRGLSYLFTNVLSDHTIEVTFGTDTSGGDGDGDGIPDVEQELQRIRPMWQASPLGELFGHIGPLGV